MKDVIVLVLSLLLFCSVLVYGGWYFGRKYEQQFWTKYYTEEMNKVCLECAGLKEYSGSYDGVPN